MREPFFPQLALFIASRPLLALYREFVFPSIPRRTGLLPSGIDDIRVSHSANTPIAIDIAVSRAAVVICDSGRRDRLPLEYIRTLRGEQPLIVVTAPTQAMARTEPQNPQPSESETLGRPAEMIGWPTDFVEPLLRRIAATTIPPTPEQIGTRLAALIGDKSWPDLLLTALALLERRMRTEDLPTTVPLEPTGGVMERLRAYFQVDYPSVIEAVSLRHDVLQNLQLSQADIERVAIAVAGLVRDKYAVPQVP